MADPLTLALIGAGGNALPSLFGQTQIGAAAPAFNPQSGGLLDTSLEQQAPVQNFQPQGFDIASLESLIGRPEQRGQELAAQVTANDIGGAGPVLPSEGVPDTFREGSTPDNPSPEGNGFLGGLDNFLGNVDRGLQSPSQLLGLGLLGQVDRRLPIAGLGLMGLLNRQK